MTFSLYLQSDFKRQYKTTNKNRDQVMTQKEFETRIGHEVTGDEFDRANAIYMAAGGMEYDTAAAGFILCHYHKTDPPGGGCTAGGLGRRL